VETDEVLETGYGPRTARGDNLTNDFAQGEADAFAALADARGDRALDDTELDLTLRDSGSGSPFGNVALVRRPLGEEEWRAAATRMHDFFAQAAGGPFMLFSAWPTPNLRGLDFGLVGHPPMMLRPAGTYELSPPDGLEIRRVDDAASAEDWEYVMVHGYPVPEVQPFAPGCILPEAALAADGWRHYLGVLDGKPVATGSAYVDPQHIHVEFISALDDVRGRGIGAALTAAATTTETDRPAMLIASDAGKATYDRMGYQTLSRFTLWAGHRRS
jgi:hypothetical protein